MEDTAMARSVDLGDKLDEFVTSLVATGRSASEDQVLREGVRLIQERENRLATLDEAIAKGIAAADAGDGKPVAQVFDRLEAKYRAMAEAVR
jgi:antitoxin ParD1/3/4